MPFAGLVSSTLLRQTPVRYSANCLAITATAGQCKHTLWFHCSPGSSASSRSFTSSAPIRSSLSNIRQRSKHQPTLVFQSTSDNPYHNLSIEHFLLTNSDPDSRILLFYTNRPCVVIGRNQNPWTECNLRLIQEGVDGRPVDLVRRRSGGGTVFHDEGNLNFSVIVPNDKDFDRRKHSELVVRALNKIHAVTSEYDGPENLWVNKRHDITMATMQNKGRTEFKVSGSAFKLTRGRALHHGTLLHSSPNLDKISKLLQASGRQWIQAKGVESVRSPVMNIYNIQNTAERDSLRTQIVNEIVKEFLRFYRADVTPEVVGDSDCLEPTNSSIAKGVKELMSDDWRFEQTPRYDFTSKVVNGREVTFAVKNGLIEDARLGLKDASTELRSKLCLHNPHQKIHEIQDWCHVFDPDIDGVHSAAIAQVFPDLSRLRPKVTSGVSISGTQVEQDGHGVVRRLQDGTVERETGFNTVEAIKS